MYLANYNTPDCAPDCEDSQFATAEDARRCVIAWILNAADFADSEDLTHFAEDVNLESGPFEITGPDGIVYWVRRAQ